MNALLALPVNEGKVHSFMLDFQSNKLSLNGLFLSSSPCVRALNLMPY